MITLRYYGKQASMSSEFVAAIVNKMDFNAGSMLGRNCVQGWLLTGQLPEQYRESASLADYVVSSYTTPIMWHVAESAGQAYDERSDGWVCPDVDYSHTTSQQQTFCRAAMAELAGDATHCAVCGAWTSDGPDGNDLCNDCIDGQHEPARAPTANPFDLFGN